MNTFSTMPIKIPAQCLGGNYTKFIWKGDKPEPPILKNEGSLPHPDIKTMFRFNN